MGSGTQVVLWEAIHWRTAAGSKRTTPDMRSRLGQSEDFVHCYDEVYAKECQREIPVALVATGLEWAGGNMHGWWEKNKDDMFHLGLAFDVHACITTLHSHDDPCIQEQINISRARVEALLRIQGYTQQLSHDHICSDQSLEHSGGIPYSPELSNAVYEGSLQTRTVVIVGATGVGKSSVINAIAGEKRAQISSDTDACTRECKSFLVELKPGVITELWDTVGWDESHIDIVTGHVQRLVSTRGIDLLLFCVRAGDRAKCHVERFKRNIQPICGKETSVALVDASVFHELIVDAHVCVTTAARSANPIHQQQVRRSLPQASLLGCTGCGKSLFISTLTGIPEDEAGVGHALQSRTHCFKAFHDTPVVLVDTPGFNNSDPKLTDESICKSISVWLHEMYKRDITLVGILYLHHTTGTPVTAHFRPFVEVYGKSIYSRVSLVTTMQDETNISQPEDLDQLVREGARRFIYENTPESARELCQNVTSDIDVARAEHLKRVVSELTQGLSNPLEDRNANDAGLEGLADEHLELLRRIREESANDGAPTELLEQCKSVRCQMEDVLIQGGQAMSPLVERVKRCLRTY
ncbi:hypothetical protein BKA83DRAFT_4270442 [Pisolithus microcarpus]|nr:hypothetical protein BKA83DRAFT_4270442 [Pisolithus microcarpus]